MEKDITFIYMDSAERSMYEPIAEEAERRGYRTRMTTDKFARCEIGFYCQHLNHPQFSKFSVIMLHDIIQQHGNWPDIWFREPWDKYDIGFLPSRNWVELWSQCSQWAYTRPRVGMFLAGWPKADRYAGLAASSDYRREFERRFGLTSGLPTLLYAPSWENDGKQDDFVKAAMPLEVNILVKQADANSALFPTFVAEVERMARLHSGNPRVTLLPSGMNIFEAIAASDALVSEESSTMCEAAMMGVPSVAVSDWPIPDVTPSRMPNCDYDFVLQARRADLSKTLADVVANLGDLKRESKAYSEAHFSNVGSASCAIMDIIDDCVEGGEFRRGQLVPNAVAKPPLANDVERRAIAFYRELYGNYAKRYPPVKLAWTAAKSAKRAVLAVRSGVERIGR